MSDSSRDIVPVEQRAVATSVSRQITVTEKVISKIIPGTLEDIRSAIGNCQRCKLAATRNSIAFGVGNPKARLVFVGACPGAEEDESGEPFIGVGGRMQNRILAAMGLKREEVYMCYVVKCSPPDSRYPEDDEIMPCFSFLQRQLHTIKPEVIVTLGICASQTMLKTKEPISKLRGKLRKFHGIPLMPTYHPNYLLRLFREHNNFDSFWEVWEDMTQVLQLLKLPVPEKKRKMPELNNTIYQQMRPHLTAMWYEAKTDASDDRAAFKVLAKTIAALGTEAHKMKPYAMKFAQEVLNGSI
jgi:uracil-DNA glycosylase family 4